MRPKVRTQILQMHPDLMHSTGTWFAENHAGSAVVAETLKIRVTVLARTRNFAYSDFVRHHFDGLFARNRLPEIEKDIRIKVIQGKIREGCPILDLYYFNDL